MWMTVLVQCSSLHPSTKPGVFSTLPGQDRRVLQLQAEPESVFIDKGSSLLTTNIMGVTNIYV